MRGTIAHRYVYPALPPLWYRRLPDLRSYLPPPFLRPPTLRHPYPPRSLTRAGSPRSSASVTTMPHASSHRLGASTQQQPRSTWPMSGRGSTTSTTAAAAPAVAPAPPARAAATSQLTLSRASATAGSPAVRRPRQHTSISACLHVFLRLTAATPGVTAVSRRHTVRSRGVKEAR